MRERMNVNDLLDHIRTTEDFSRLDVSAADSAWIAIRREFETTADPFDRHRSISAQIGATDSMELRRLLKRLRAEFEKRMLSAAISGVQQAFEDSPEYGWRAWLTELAAALAAFHHRHSLRLCEHDFAFDASRREIVGNIRRAVQRMLQSRWDETYEELDFLTEQELLPGRSRAQLIAIVGQIELWWFENRTRAHARLQVAEKMAPEDGLVLATVGDCLQAERKLEKAANYYQRAIERSPRIASGYTGMGDRFKNDESLEEAVRLDLAEEWYRKAISSAGGDSSGHGRLLELLGRPGKLEKHEQEFLALAQTRLNVDAEMEYSTHLEVGQCYLNNKRIPEARRWYEQAIALQNHWPHAYTKLAALCREQGKDKEAEALCSKAIEVAPDCPDGCVSLANIYEAGSRWSDALRIYSTFPQLQRRCASSVRASVGRMHAKLENYPEAERVLLEQLRSDPSDHYARRALEEIADGFYQERKDKELARRVYDELLQTLGERYLGSYHNRLGNMHYFFDEYGPAVEEYLQATAAEPDQAVYHRNLSGGYQLLRNYANADHELERAFAIDKDEKLLRQKRASLANAQGNDAYEKGDYREAITHYTEAVDLNPDQPVYHTNLAGAWKQLKEPGQREHAIEQAIHCYECARKIAHREDTTGQIDRLRRRKAVARRYGEKALDFFNVVSPIAVEVAADLIPYVEGATPETPLSDELSSEVNTMRERLLEQLGAKIPGIRFRGNETDLPLGTYIVMINEIPLASGNLSTKCRFCPASAEDLSRLDVHGEPASDPLTGQDGVWVNSEDWDKVESPKVELWGITKYLMRHVESVVRKNLCEFLGHQEIVNLLETEGESPLEEIRGSSAMVTSLTTVCRALVAEEVPIQPFRELCSTFSDLHRRSVGLRHIVEHIRALPAFRERLAGNDGRHSLVGLSERFEAEIRRSLYERDDRAILAMEPERCQKALTAVRNQVKDQVNGRSIALVVEAPTLRPFVRKLVELEFPSLHVLSRPELRPEVAAVPVGFIDLESDPTTEKVAFGSPRRFDALATKPGTDRAALAPAAVRIEVCVGQDFETQASAADDKPIREMLSLMQDGLFYELGIILPEVQLRTDPSIKSLESTIRLNGGEPIPVRELGPDEFLVNDTVDRLTLLGIQGRKAVNPANGSECTIVRDTKGEAGTCIQAGLTAWGPHGYLVLCLSSAIRRAAAQFQTDEATQHCLDSLAEAFPDLVRLALERYTLSQITLLLGELLDEEISIRDLRSILECLLSIDGTTDVDLGRFIVFFANAEPLCPAVATRSPSRLMPSQLADFVRASLKRYISYKYTRGSNTMVVYLLDPDIEKRIATTGARPLSGEEEEKLRTAIRVEVGSLPPTSGSAVLLTSFEIRRALRTTIVHEFPRLAVLSYQELSPDMNIQPIARISWD